MFEHESISQKIYQLLKQEIVSSQLAAGARLVVSPLSKRFGVSSIPVREALFRLAAEKLIVLEHNKGFRVAATPDASDILQWQQARLMVEPAVAELVVAQITPGEIAQLRQMNQAMRSHDYGPRQQEYRFFINLNADFHRQIVIASRNDLVIEMYRTLNYGPQVGRSHEGRGVPDLALLCDEHEAMIDALEQRDAQRYRQLATDHVTNGFHRQIGESQP